MNALGPLTRRQVFVRGRVQGVGYRWFVKELAESMRLAGWVRNSEDGSVELEVEGSTSSLDEFLRRLRTGNPSAKVSELVALPVAPRGGNGFEIK
ncbi:MAG: acylphosphatase [Elusimicrobiota bacterium]